MTKCPLDGLVNNINGKTKLSCKYNYIQDHDNINIKITLTLYKDHEHSKRSHFLKYCVLDFTVPH